MQADAKTLCRLYDVDRRTLTNWINADPACPSRMVDGVRVFDTAAVAKWREERAARKALAATEAVRTLDVERARARREEAMARLAEMDVGEREGALVRVETHRAVFEEMAGRLRAVLLNVPSTYALDLERVGVEAGAAQGVLEQISDALTAALRGAVEDAGGDADGEPDDDGASV